MGIGCGASIARLILFVFNFIFFVGGAAVFGLGIWLRVDPNAFKHLRILQVNQNDQLIQAAVLLMILVGAFILILGFFGCCGACKKSTCLLCLYGFLLGLVFALLLTAGILALVFRGKVDSFLQKDMTNQVKNEYGLKNDSLTRAWNSMQYGHVVPLTCCTPINGSANPDVPLPRNEAQCMRDAKANPIPRNSTSLFTQGCHPALRSKIIQYIGIIVGGAAALLVIMVVVMCLTGCLRKAIKREMAVQ